MPSKTAAPDALIISGDEAIERVLSQQGAVVMPASAFRLDGFVNDTFSEYVNPSIYRPASVCNAGISSNLQDVHQLSLAQAEEDVCTLLWSLESPTTGLLFPFMEDLPSQTWIDRQPPEDRRAFMDSYKRTIQRHVFEAGGKRFLNKNVFFSTRVRSVYEKFPDAAFVYLVRDPHDCLPSFLNIFYQAWKAHSPNIRPDSEEIQALKDLGYIQ